MLVEGVRNSRIEYELVIRIEELRSLVPDTSASRRFRILCDVLGYRLAERVFSQYIRLRKLCLSH